MNQLSLLRTVLAVGVLVQNLTGQPVLHHPNTKEPLAVKWAWAVKEALSREFVGGYWIGYGIRRLMGQYSHIGSFSERSGRYGESLHELLYGQKEFEEEVIDDEAIRREAARALEGKRWGEEVPKVVAILFAYNLSATGESRFSKITISNLSLTVDLGERPLLWLGNADEEESVCHLQKQFDILPTIKLKESALLAISLHDSSKQARVFLRTQLTKAEEERIRARAAFSLGNRGQKEDLPLLVETATSDNSRHVREQAVFGISQMRIEEATETLIGLAKNGPSREVRSRAIFWLSQKISEMVLPALKDLVHNDPDIHLREEAVFALSRLKDGNGVKELVEIAKTHDNDRVRKQAIFWLGQSKDPRALEALMEMVRGR